MSLIPNLHRSPAMSSTTEQSREEIIRKVFRPRPSMIRVAFKTRDRLIAFEEVEEVTARSGQIKRAVSRLAASIRSRYELRETRLYSWRGEMHEGCPVFEED